MNLESLIEGLSSPDAYAHASAPIDVVQTHISAVFLAGDRAYKIKKPLDLGFLDFTTLERRQHFCHEEVRLNRRLAPDVYLGSCQSRPTAKGCGSTAMAMPSSTRSRCDACRTSGTLESLLDRGELDEGLLEQVAARCRRSTPHAASGADVSHWGKFETVAGNARENFEQVEPYVGSTITASRVRAAARRSRSPTWIGSNR